MGIWAARSRKAESGGDFPRLDFSRHVDKKECQGRDDQQGGNDLRHPPQDDDIAPQRYSLDVQELFHDSDVWTTVTRDRAGITKRHGYENRGMRAHPPVSSLE